MSVSSLRRGHANLLCIVPILLDATEVVHFLVSGLLTWGALTGSENYGAFLVLMNVEETIGLIVSRNHTNEREVTRDKAGGRREIS